MKVEAVNPRTKEKISMRLSAGEAAKLRDLDKERVSENQLDAFLDQLKQSKATQAMLTELKKVTVLAEGQTIQLGRRVIEIAVALQQQFPCATFGVIVGLVVSILVTAIPILGTVISGVVTPVAVIVGLAVGAGFDIRDKALYKKITEATAIFDPLRPSFKEGKRALDQLFEVLAPQS